MWRRRNSKTTISICCFIEVSSDQSERSVMLIRYNAKNTLFLRRKRVYSLNIYEHIFDCFCNVKWIKLTPKITYPLRWWLLLFDSSSIPIFLFSWFLCTCKHYTRYNYMIILMFFLLFLLLVLLDWRQHGNIGRDWMHLSFYVESFDFHIKYSVEMKDEWKTVNLLKAILDRKT